jgi:hypothetical protein
MRALVVLTATSAPQRLRSLPSAVAAAGRRDLVRSLSQLEINTSTEVVD